MPLRLRPRSEGHTRKRSTMPDQLPSVWITSQSPIALAEALRDLIVQGGVYNVAHNEVFNDTATILLRAEAHVGLEFYVHKESNTRLSIELRGCELSFDDYASAASSIVKPFLKAFNKANDTRYRLFVEGRKSFKLPERAARYFKHFSDQANKTNLHHLDWRRFYYFVRYAPDLSEAQLRPLFEKSDFSNSQAEEMLTAFWHIKLFLQRPPGAEILEMSELRKSSQA